MLCRPAAIAIAKAVGGGRDGRIVCLVRGMELVAAAELVSRSLALVNCEQIGRLPYARPRRVRALGQQLGHSFGDYVSRLEFGNVD